MADARGRAGADLARRALETIQGDVALSAPPLPPAESDAESGIPRASRGSALAQAALERLQAMQAAAAAHPFRSFPGAEAAAVLGGPPATSPLPDTGGVPVRGFVPVTPETLASQQRARQTFVEMFPLLGAILGGTAGGVASAPFAGPGVPVVAAGTAAAGAGAGRLLQAPAAAVLGVEAPPSPTGSALRDALASATGGFLGELGGRGLIGLGRGLAAPFRLRPVANAPRLREALTETGVPPKLTDVTPSRPAAVLERGAEQTLTGSAVMTPVREAQQAGIRRAADEFLATLGPEEARSAMQAGQAASNAIRATAERTGAIENQMFAELSRLAAGGAAPVRISLTRTKALARQLAATQAARLPAQRDAALVTLAAQIDRAPGAVPFERARAIQQGLGSAIDRGELLSRQPIGESKALFRAVTEDIEAAIEQSGRRDLVRGFQTARTFAENRRSLLRDSQVARVLETPPEEIVRTLDVTGGPTAVTQARAAILGTLPPGQPPTPDAQRAWDLVRRHIAEGIIERSSQEVRGLAGRVLSGARLERELARLGPDTLAELYSPLERRALENLTLVAKATQASERVGAAGFTSTTPQGLATQGLFFGAGAGPGGVLGGLMGGQPGAMIGAALGGGASSLALPALVAKVVTSPRLAAFVASGDFRKLALATRVTAETTRLAARWTGLLIAEGLIPAPSVEPKP